MKSAGVLMRLTTSQKMSSATKSNPTIPVPLGRRGSDASGWREASVVTVGPSRERPACRSRDSTRRVRLFLRRLDEVGRRRDHLEVGLLAALDLVDGDRVRRRVALLVDLERAEDAVLDVRLEQLLGDGRARPVR